MIIEFDKEKLKGSIQLPASKSLYNRALMIQALSEYQIQIDNKSDSNDSVLLEKALTKVRNSSESTITIDVEDAGTPFRFLTAFLSMQQDKYFVLTGNQGLCKRPISDLVNALLELGASINYLEKIGLPPISIQGKNLRGKEITINGNVSSQFISSLCLIAPNIENGLHLKINKPIVSSQYILMTLELMKNAGINFTKKTDIDYLEINIEQQTYQSTMFQIVNDWSSASFIFSMAILSDEVDITIQNLSLKSLQGDSMIVQIAKDFGIETKEIDGNLHLARTETIHSNLEKHYHLSDNPDMAIPLIVACAIQYPKITFSGLHHLELKESKRLTALKTELGKLNIHLNYENDLLTFSQNKKTQQPKVIAFESYDDHRIVMALSMIALEGIKVEFNDTECVKKSFPNYFNEIKKLGFEIKDSK